MELVYLLTDNTDADPVGAFATLDLAKEAALVWLDEYSGTLREWRKHDGSYWANHLGGCLRIYELQLQREVNR